jgi:hypothetical protein
MLWLVFLLALAVVYGAIRLSEWLDPSLLPPPEPHHSPSEIYERLAEKQEPASAASHKAERAPSSPPAPNFGVASRDSDLAAAAEYDDEETYADFVARMWEKPTLTFAPIIAQRDGVACTIVAIVDLRRSYPYVNVWEAGQRKTYAGDHRHLWTRDGVTVDESAFLAVLSGENPNSALRAEPYPRTLEEALQKDRVQDDGRRFAIHYRNADHQVSWRIVSRIRRGREHMVARCHFRWGQRRTFRYDRIAEIVEIDTGEFIPVAEFAFGRPLPNRKKRPKDKG